MVSAGAAHERTEDDIASLAAGRRVIIAANRGPVEFHLGPSGQLSTRRGPGGVVTALASLARDLPLTWVAAAMTAGDRQAFPGEDAPAREVRLGQQVLRVRYVPVSPEQYTRYYDEMSNTVLWFLQHYLWDPARSPDFGAEQYVAWDEGYRSVNQAIARAVAAEATASTVGRRRGRAADGSDAIVLLQDYHLYLAAAGVRARLPRATIQQFIHIPWPTVRYWEFLPNHFLLEIFESMAMNDVLGFQTVQDVQNFLYCAREFLSESRVDFDRGTVLWRRHRLIARAYPVPVDVREVRGVLTTPVGQRCVREIGGLVHADTQLLVRVDRLDPSKNIVRGFRAYQLLLQRYPEQRGNVQFLAFLVPSRQGLTRYRRYDRDVRAIIKEINQQFGTEEWQPITAFFENNRSRALAAMERYDTLLVNPVLDGMNLVAKEGPAVNTRSGVLILSRTAGAYAQLKSAALPVTATDIEETADQMHEALLMSAHERAQRAEIARQVVEQESPIDWVRAQLSDAARVRGLSRERTARQPRAEQPRAEQPRAEQPRAEQPRAEQPREDGLPRVG